MIYLLPINFKLNEFATTIKFMENLQKLSTSVKMSYVNITLDVLGLP